MEKLTEAATCPGEAIKRRCEDRDTLNIPEEKIAIRSEKVHPIYKFDIPSFLNHSPQSIRGDGATEEEAAHLEEATRGSTDSMTQDPVFFRLPHVGTETGISSVGADISRHEHADDAGAISQETSTQAQIPFEQNVLFYAQSRIRPAFQREAGSWDVLDEFGIEGFLSLLHGPDYADQTLSTML